jgi:hypothetical protein
VQQKAREFRFRNMTTMEAYGYRDSRWRAPPSAAHHDQRGASEFPILRAVSSSAPDVEWY